MPISSPSLPTVPDGLHVDELTLYPSGLSGPCALKATTQSRTV